jgi:hypothetical protein
LTDRQVARKLYSDFGRLDAFGLNDSAHAYDGIPCSRKHLLRLKTSRKALRDLYDGICAVTIGPKIYTKSLPDPFRAPPIRFAPAERNARRNAPLPRTRALTPRPPDIGLA